MEETEKIRDKALKDVSKLRLEANMEIFVESINCAKKSGRRVQS